MIRDLLLKDKHNNTYCRNKTATIYIFTQLTVLLKKKKKGKQEVKKVPGSPVNTLQEKPVFKFA